MTRSRRGRPPHDDVLTPTEWRVVHAIQHGLSNREIAARRGISRDAVNYHVANAVAKLGVANRQALRRWFREPRSSALGRKERPMASTVRLGALAQIFAFFDCGGTRLYLSAEAKPGPESILYLRVEDIRAPTKHSVHAVSSSAMPHT